MVQSRWLQPSRSSGGWRTSSKYREVPDNYFSLNTPSVIYFWKPEAKSSSMKMTPTIMITSGGWMTSSKYGEVPDSHFHLTPPQLSNSISISININTNFRLSEDDPRHEDHYQGPQEEGGHPPSMWRFPTTIFHLTPKVLYIFGNLRQNQVQWRWLQILWSPSAKEAKEAKVAEV